MNSVFNWFGGRSSAFSLWFFVVGVVLAFQGKLDSNFIALGGAVQALIVTRSIAGDYHERNVKVVIGAPGPPGPAGKDGKDAEVKTNADI